MEYMMTAEQRNEYRRVQKLLKEEPDITGKHPQQFNVESYYHANHRDKTQKLVLQKGLANFSSLKFGDERLWYEQSFTQDVFNPKVSLEVADYGLSKERIQANRDRDYSHVLERFGKEDIEAIEANMREKLGVRSNINAYQMRKTFKYFDHEGTGGISLPEIRHIFELMGFQLSEQQVLALFATYDKQKTGQIKYKDFIQRLVEKDFVEVKDTWLMSKPDLEKMNNKRRSVAEKLRKEAAAKATAAGVTVDYDAAEYAESLAFEKAEVCRIFDFLDNTGKGLDEHQLMVLLMILGHGFNKSELAGLANRAKSGQERVDFNKFWAWHLTR